MSIQFLNLSVKVYEPPSHDKIIAYFDINYCIFHLHLLCCGLCIKLLSEKFTLPHVTTKPLNLSITLLGRFSRSSDILVIAARRWPCVAAGYTTWRSIFLQRETGRYAIMVGLTCGTLQISIFKLERVNAFYPTFGIQRTPP